MPQTSKDLTQPMVDADIDAGGYRQTSGGQGRMHGLSTFIVAGLALVACTAAVTEVAVGHSALAHDHALHVLEARMDLAEQRHEEEMEAVQASKSAQLWKMGDAMPRIGIVPMLSQLQSVQAGNATAIAQLNTAVATLTTAVATTQAAIADLNVAILSKANQADVSALEEIVRHLSHQVAQLHGSVHNSTTEDALSAEMAELRAHLSVVISSKANQADVTALEDNMQNISHQVAQLRGSVHNLTTEHASTPSQLVEARQSDRGIDCGYMNAWVNHELDISQGSEHPELLDGLKPSSGLRTCNALTAVKFNSLGFHPGHLRITWGAQPFSQNAYSFAYSTDGRTWTGIPSISTTACNQDPARVKSPGIPQFSNHNFVVPLPTVQFLWFGLSTPCETQQVSELEYLQ